VALFWNLSNYCLTKKHNMNTIRYNWKLVLIAGLLAGGILTGCKDSRDYKSIDKEAPSGDATTMDSAHQMPVDQSMTSQDNTSDKPTTNAGPNASSTMHKKGTKGRASVNMKDMNRENRKMTKAVRDADGIYSRADVMPAYPGGEEALQKFVEDNIQYPEDAIQQGQEADVKVVFTVNESGKVTNAKVIGDNDVEYALKEEAVAVVNKMPDWTPGMVNGKKVKTRLQLPISFKIVE
jgi:TonB family protein